MDGGSRPESHNFGNETSLCAVRGTRVNNLLDIAAPCKLRSSELYKTSAHLTSKPQKVALKVLTTDAIAILGTEPARLPVQQVSGHSSLSNG